MITIKLLGPGEEGAVPVFGTVSNNSVSIDGSITGDRVFWAIDDAPESFGETSILAVVLANPSGRTDQTAGDVLEPSNSLLLQESGWALPDDSEAGTGWVWLPRVVSQGEGNTIFLLIKAAIPQPLTFNCLLYFYSANVGVWYADSTVTLPFTQQAIPRFTVGTGMLKCDPQGMLYASSQQYFNDYIGMNTLIQSNPGMPPPAAVSSVTVYGLIDPNDGSSFLQGIEVTLLGSSTVLHGSKVDSGVQLTPPEGEWLSYFQWTTIDNDDTFNGIITSIDFFTNQGTKLSAGNPNASSRSGIFTCGSTAMNRPLVALCGFLGRVLGWEHGDYDYPVALGGVFASPQTTSTT